MGRSEERDELLRGTLYLLILKTLVREPMHGWGIAERIQTSSEDALTVEEGSLYPALQRMLLKGWVTAEWGQSQNNRRARYYSITAAGRRQLELELSQYRRVTGAIAKVLATT